MTRGAIAIVVCLGAAVLAAGRADVLLAQVSGQARDGQRTFRTGAEAVRVDVSVRDGRRPVTALTAADFHVYDNGVLQQVTEVGYDRLPIDVTVALDVSQSVDGPMLSELREATLQLMADLADGDRLKLIGFNMRITRVLDFTTDVAAVERAIAGAAAGGGSSIRDAASVAMVAAGDPDRRQLVVLFTDGADSSSTTSEAALMDVVRRTRASLTAVVPERLRRVRTSSRVRQYLSWLESLTGETGGTVLTAGRNLSSTFQRALEEFRSSYVLYFTPGGVEPAGFHTLEVRIPRNDGYEVRARRGYFGR